MRSCMGSAPGKKVARYYSAKGRVWSGRMYAALRQRQTKRTLALDPLSPPLSLPLMQLPGDRATVGGPLSNSPMELESGLRCRNSFVSRPPRATTFQLGECPGERATGQRPRRFGQLIMSVQPYYWNGVMDMMKVQLAKFPSPPGPTPTARFGSNFPNSDGLGKLIRFT